MSVKTIEPQSIAEWPLRETVEERLFGDTVVSADLLGWMRDRLDEGEDVYGTTWCSKDLKQDMLEEIVDLANYTLMSLARRLIAHDFDATMETTYGAIAEQISTLYFWVNNLEDFDEGEK